MPGPLQRDTAPPRTTERDTGSTAGTRTWAGVAPTPNPPRYLPVSSRAPQLQPARQLLLDTVHWHPSELVAGDAQSAPRTQETVVAVVEAKPVPATGARQRHRRSGPRRDTVQPMVREKLPQLTLLHLRVPDPVETQSLPVHPDPSPPTRFAHPSSRPGSLDLDLENGQQQQRNPGEQPDHGAPDPLHAIAHPDTQRRLGRSRLPLPVETAGRCTHQMLKAPGNVALPERKRHGSPVAASPGGGSCQCPLTVVTSREGAGAGEVPQGLVRATGCPLKAHSDVRPTKKP